MRDMHKSHSKKSNSNFSALELDRDLRFSRGHQPHDDDDDEKEDDEMEDNNNDKGISALGLDRDLRFSQFDVPSLQGY